MRSGVERVLPVGAANLGRGYPLLLVGDTVPRATEGGQHALQ